MRKSSFENTLLAFHMYMNWDIHFLVKIQRAKSVVKKINEKQGVFEAFVLRICANWEILVEELLIDCLNKDTSQYRQYTGYKIPKDISKDMCKAILIGIGYIDFKSVGHLKKLSRCILVPKCNPFDQIPGPNGRKIDEFFTIRNYLAHYSDQARRSLFDIYKKRYNLKTFLLPGRFLLAQDKKANIPRMGVYINNFKKTVHIMEKFLKVYYR